MGQVVSRNWLPPAVRQDLATLRRGVGLIFALAPRCATAIGALRVVEALLPAAHVWLLKRIIDTVAVQRGNAPSADVALTALTLAGSYFLLVCLQQSLGAISRLLQGQIHDLLGGRVTLRVMQKVSEYPDLSPFETPAFHDRLRRLEQEAAWQPMNLFGGLAHLGQSALTLLLMLLFIAHLHPALVLVLAATASPTVFFQRRLQQAVWGHRVEVTPLRRRLADYARVLLTAPFAKEVRLYGFSRHFLDRYEQQFDDLMTRVNRMRRRTIVTSVALSLLAALGVGSAFGYVIYQALRGALTLGDLSLYTGALFQASGAAMSVAGGMAMLHETLPFMRELFLFLDSKPAVSGPAAGGGVSDYRSPAPGRRQCEGFSLDRVTFRYPETDRPIFTELSLEIPWGKTTAIVGENGAGKSTLVKLLTRLFDPTGGRILLNGIDLREYDLDDLRSRVAVVFQDFSRYQLSVWENIGIGDVRHLHERGRISEAARRAGADRVIRRLPQGEETLLGREFDGGVELSGGEWQKIALARAFMRDAPILILDEPTAALDARSEHEIYQRFVDLSAGRTTLLISHRFSTVRMADHIVVLENGQIIEKGDHRELVARDGRYAELYAMQAARYGL